MREQFRFVLFAALLGALVLGTVTAVRAGVIPQFPSVRITDTGADLSPGVDPYLYEHNGTLHAVWLDSRDGAFKGVYHARSTDQGATWSANHRVSRWPQEDWANEPTIAVDAEGDLWVMYNLYYNDSSDNLNDVVLVKSTDNGDSWLDENRFRIVDGVNGDSDNWRNILISSETTGLLHALVQDWVDLGSDEGMNLLLANINPAAESVVAAQVNDVGGSGRIGDALQDYGPLMSIAERDGKICAAWEDTRERYSIYGACSTNGGVSFGANFRVSPSDSLQPEIAIAPNGDLYVIYVHDETFVRQLILRRSTDNGVTWGPERIAAEVSGGELNDWRIQVDENGQIVVASTGTDSSDPLYFSTSLDGGESFAQVYVTPEGDEPSLPRLITAGSGTDSWAYVMYRSDDDLRGLRAILDGIAPTPPTGLSATGAERAVQLAWSPASDANGVAGYHVFRATAADGAYAQITTTLVRTTTYVDVELIPGTTYFYRVRAYDGTNNRSDVSNTASAAALALATPQYAGTIAYESGANVRIQPVTGGEAQTIATAASPVFSANGEQIYYSTGDFVQRRAVAGGSPEVFFEDSSHYLFDIAADNQTFVSLLQRTVPSMVTGGFCFVLEPRVARPGVELYVSQFELADSAAISADYKYAAYTSYGWCNAAATAIYSPPRLCLIDVAAGEENCQVFGEIADPDFAPAGHEIVFAAEATGSFEIWRATVNADLTLSNHTQLTRGGAANPSRAPAFSQDGQWIVFQRDMDPGDGEDWQLHIVRADGVGVRSLNIAGENPAMIGGGGVVLGPNKNYLPNISK